MMLHFYKCNTTKFEAHKAKFQDTHEGNVLKAGLPLAGKELAGELALTEF